MFEVQMGCEEWWDTSTFETFEEAEECVKSYNRVFEMGCYPAEYVWTDNLETEERTFYYNCCEDEDDCCHSDNDE